ncbi:MAG: VWA domain-containing protein [Polyangiaceae bacterium]
MNFLQPYFLIGSALSLIYGALLLFGALRSRKARIRFGEEPRIESLVTHDASKRRAWKGIFLMLATALAFVAAARPQYGKGQRLIPHANVDVIIVLDYSKSMYAKDVEPSRIFRAKVEVQGLIQKLRGARFGAVAFAGEALSYPLTADGSAIASFLKHLEPNDMPVGGTAIATALDKARDILRSDPKFKEHKKIIVLITDGEDLEGNPLAVAKAIGGDKTTIHVVQIGHGSAEPIPEIGEKGDIIGWRQTKNHQPMMTELSPKGERTLKQIAETTGGKVIQASKGSTGIEEIASELQRQMKTDFTEKVETVYADVFMYPLIAALVLLLLEAAITDAPARRFVRKIPPLKQMSPALREALGIVQPAALSPFAQLAQQPPPPPPPELGKPPVVPAARPSGGANP